MRACLDTNILVSAALFRGNERALLELAMEGKLELVLSVWILAELEKVLWRIGMSKQARYGYISRLRGISELVRPPTRGLRDEVRDAADRKVLGTAITGSCDYLVTGDKELLSLGEVRGVRIIRTSEALSKLRVK